MPTISRLDSIAATTRSANLLDGEQFEFLAQASVVSLGVSASAVGLTLDFFVGGVAQVVAAVPPLGDRFPIRPDDVLVAVGGLPGERMALFATNTTGGALTLHTLVDIQT